ncbi:MAG: hypothetical protein EPO65_02170 [Dehalococcoidia bacterium]|nr:MAG: hypothetical protein EPO65_02170 [Dehalococcoidia bacterium]
MADSIRTARTALTSERTAIERRITDLRARVAEIDEVLQSLTALETRLPVGPEPTLKNARSQAEGGEGRLPRGALRTAIVETLRAHTGGLHISRILEVLARSGRAPRSTNPRGSVQTTLYAMRREGLVDNKGKNSWVLLQRARATRKKK